VRIERVVLEHHGDVALFRGHPVDDLVPDADFARGDVLETGEHAEQRCLAAPRWTDQNDEFAVRDFEGYAFDDGRGAERLPDIQELH
jgi:hypothetical protein